jgi:hypothetical protein
VGSARTPKQAAAKALSQHPAPEAKIFAVALVVAFLAFGLAALAQIAVRKEQRTGPVTPKPPQLTTPASLLYGLSLHMSQPGRQAKLRDMCLAVGACAFVVCVVAVLYGAHHR